MTTMQSLDTRVRVLPLPEHLQLEIQKFFYEPWKLQKHPVAELVKSRDFVEQYRDMLYDRSLDDDVENWEELPAEVRELAWQNGGRTMKGKPLVQRKWDTPFEAIAYLLYEQYMDESFEGICERHRARDWESQWP